MFLTVSLYWYSIFERFQLRASPLGQIADLRLLADVIRISYFVPLVCALWGTVLKSCRSTARWPDPSTISSAADSEIVPPTAWSNPLIVKRFFTLMVGAGLMNSLIAGILLCRLPESHSPTSSSLCVRAVLYVLAGLLTGAGGTYLYWKNPASPFSTREPLPFSLFALICAGGWVWVPATVILTEQMSPASPFVAMIGAFVLTSGLRRVSSSLHGPIPNVMSASERGEVTLFTESLYPAPHGIDGYLVALSLYAGATALCVHAYLGATVLLVIAASVFAWKRTIPQDLLFNEGQVSKRAALRLARIAIPALLVTFWSLLDGVAHRNLLVEAGTGSAPRLRNAPRKEAAPSSTHRTAALGAGGYESVILWPYPDKKQVLPPIAVQNELLPPGTREPLVIRFNGPYWYFQPPNKFPGPTAHKTNGTPLGFDIRSDNSVPLVMDAHQYLSAAIPIARCREITVEIENRDNTAGAVSLGVLLTDGTSAKRSAVYLGEQPIASTRPGHFAYKSGAVFETLHFSVPANARVRRFSEITVLILPDIERTLEAPKVAIQQFQLYPR
jgi:hypothetical protein